MEEDSFPIVLPVAVVAAVTIWLFRVLWYVVAVDAFGLPVLTFIQCFALLSLIAIAGAVFNAVATIKNI